MHNFKLTCCDTDSITICKPDGSVFSEQEIQNLTQELNDLYPDLIEWDLEPIIDKMIVVKSKNYVLLEQGKIKYKGSSLKSPSLEPALREFIQKIVECILNENNNYTEIYLQYVREINSITDIKRWASRKTISSKTLESERTNESKVRDAIEDTEYVEGDRIFCYFAQDNSLKLVEQFNNDHNKLKLLEKLNKASKRFETVLDYKNLFKNYSLKRSQKDLEEILNATNYLEKSEN